MEEHSSIGQRSQGLDACEWRRLLPSFKNNSSDLCKTLAQLTINREIDLPRPLQRVSPYCPQQEPGSATNWRW